MATNIEKELSETLSKYKKEVNELRTKLNQVDEQKEVWFEKKEQIKQQISDVIGRIKSCREQRDRLTKQVKDDKEKREGLNKSVKSRISELNKTRKERDELLRKLKLKKSPDAIKKNIEELELRIETDALSFDAEQKVMKKIKELKRALQEAEKAGDVWAKVDSMTKAATSLRNEAEATHLKIQGMAAESQKRHEEMILLSKGMDGLREKEKEAYEKFFEFKKQFSETNNLLQEKLIEMNKVKEELDRCLEKKHEERRLKEEKFFEEKEKEVQEKIKRGKKLTTKDLLVFQREGKEHVK